MSSNQISSFIWCKDGGKSFTFEGQQITFDEIKDLMKGSMEDAESALEEVFTAFGIPFNRRIKRTDLGDNPSERATNFTFTKHGTNVVEQNLALEITKDVLDSGRFGRSFNGQGFWYRKAIEHAISVCTKFQRTLACSMYLTGGQPPRGTELLAAQISNTATRIRNIFSVNGHAVSILFLNKTSYSGRGDRAVARAYPNKLTQVMFNYLMLIRPVEKALLSQIIDDRQRLQAYSTYLFCGIKGPLTTDDLNVGFRTLIPQHFANFPQGLTIRALRQIGVYAGQKFVAPRCTQDRVAILDLQAGHTSDIAKRWYGVEDNALMGNMADTQLEAFMEISFTHHKTFDLDQESHQFIDPSALGLLLLPHNETPVNSIEQVDGSGPDFTIIKQAKSSDQAEPDFTTLHDSSSIPNFTIIKTPGISQSKPTPSLGCQEQTIPIQFALANAASHPSSTLSVILSKLQDIQASVTALPRTLEDTHVSHRPHPHLPIVSPDLLVALRLQLKNPQARFRSFEQADAVSIASERRQDLLAVLPTGAGKTEIFMLNAYLERRLGMTTVVMVPLTTIRKQHVALARERGLVAHEWPSESYGDLLVCLFEVAALSSFMEEMVALNLAGRLGRIVVDEVHYLFSAETGFRSMMTAMGNLASIGACLVLLTGTLPPQHVSRQLQLVGLSKAVEVRSPTTRKNIYYEVRYTPMSGKSKSGLSPLQAQAAHAVQTLRQYFDGLVPKVTDFIPRKTAVSERTAVVVFFQWTDLIDEIHKLEPQWLPLHAKMNNLQKDQNLALWGTTNRIALASSLIGLGFHRDYIRVAGLHEMDGWDLQVSSGPGNHSSQWMMYGEEVF
ncbi:hypothetical protein FRB90_007049 [Tulasnella sp. 427]|nr:hypothetical protein FRB90_007049 [Tulasnella sp. 427]